MKNKKILNYFIGLSVFGLVAVISYIIYLTNNLPKIITVEDYHPLVVSKIYAKDGKQIGEFYRERRIIVPYDKIPVQLIHAFIAAEDSSFFDHGGINFTAIFRAAIANLKAGKRVQGGSTITQQVAKSLLLTPEKTYTRKIKEAVLAYRMEANLSKEEILYLYLNQIYLGQGAYGVEAAAQTYFQKSVDKLNIEEMAILAGLPQAPSRYSPTRHPERAKNRQKYVLNRMAEEEYITPDQAKELIHKPVLVYKRENYDEVAPHYVETLRQYLVETLGENKVLDEGIQIYTGLDYDAQVAARKSLQDGLRELDKRQGYRGPQENISDPEKVNAFLKKIKRTLYRKAFPTITILEDGRVEDEIEENIDLNAKIEEPKDKENKNLLNYLSIDDLTEAIVTKIDDKWGLVYVRFGESQGLIDMESMKWARKPNPEVRHYQDEISKPSDALKEGDIIEVRIVNDRFSSNEISKKLAELKRQNRKDFKQPEDLPNFDAFLHLHLEQEPIAEAGLISFDINTDEIIAMVGGYDYKKSQFNRTIQAARQPGSSFKSIIFASALDKGYTPSTVIVDSPIVYEEKVLNEEGEETDEVKKWKPLNYSEKFSGDILFRRVLIESKNIPTVKILQDVGVNWVSDYAKRLGIFSPMNHDLSLALGSSSVTLYEMTKVFSQFAKNGLRIRPKMLQKVTDIKGNVLIEEVSLDERFKEEIAKLDESFEEKRNNFLEELKKLKEQNVEKEANGEIPPEHENSKESIIAKLKKKKHPDFFYDNPDQLIDPKTAYLTTTLLQGVIQEGTGRRAKALGHPAAGKTGTTNGSYDAWFVGYTAHIATGVWVGFDNERTLGVGEGGGVAALPIWLEYMKSAHQNRLIKNFPVPQGIVFANIDTDNGDLASAKSKSVVRQAFREGLEPTKKSGGIDSVDDKDLFKEDLVD